MARRTSVLVATILGSSMAFVDGTVVNVALPTIGRDLGLGLVGRQWVFLAYALPLASLYLPGGGLADRLGRRRVFLWGVAGFALASLLAGAAPNAMVLFAARAAQGAAGAFLAVASLSLLRVTYGAESGRAVGLWSAWSGVTTIFGPPLGGMLTQWASWRLVFLINLPVAAAAWLLAWRGAPAEPRTGSVGELDLAGGALFAGAFAAVTFALVHPSRWWLFAVGAVLLAAAVLWEARTRDPILPLAVFRDRGFTTAAIETFLVYAALSASTFYLVLYLQSVVGYTPLEASLVLLPISVLLLVLAGRFGAVADRNGPRLLLTVGPALLAAGMVLWLGVTELGQWWLTLLGALVFALGLSMVVAPITAAAMNNAPERLAGIAAGVSNTTARVGGLVSVALVGLVLEAAYSGAGAPLTSSGARGASIHAFRSGTAVSIGLALAGSATALIGFGGAGGPRLSRRAALLAPRPRPQSRP